VDALLELTPVRTAFEVRGKTYYLSPLRVNDWAEAGAVVQARKAKPLDLAKEQLPRLADADRRALLELAFDAERWPFPAHYEILRWFATPEGKRFETWLMLRRNHPEITLEGTEVLMEQAQAEAIEEARVVARQDVPAGNSVSRTVSQATADVEQHLGEQSSAA
jgi:hypothetical protein